MCFLCLQHQMYAGVYPGHIEWQPSALRSGEISKVSQAFTGSESYIQAISDGLSWTGSAGTAATIGYNFSFSVEGGTVLSAAAQAGALSAMQAFSNVANITFNEVSAAAAELTFSQKDLGAGTLGLTGTFFSGNRILSSEVILDDRYTSDFSVGSEAYLVFLHELGHAMGLKHSGNYGGSDTPPFLSAEDDTYEATVMSYVQGAVVNDSNPPQGPMIYDIAALQYLYGANTSFASGDSTYSFDGSANAMAIWDGGGSDVISAAVYTGTSPVTLDLREGLDTFSSIGNAHIWAAFGANIENAEGSNVSDTIYGNGLANILLGRGGSDTIYGGDEADSIYGGVGLADSTDMADLLYGEGGSDLVVGNAGNDTLFGGTGLADSTDLADTIYGGTGYDSVIGNAGDDLLYGGGSDVNPNDNADTIFGGKGADTIIGNGDDDQLYGGGAEVNPTDDGDVIYGGQGNDYILANGGNDSVHGQVGNDTLHGGQGNDVFFFADNGGVDSLLSFDNPGALAGDLIQLTSNINGSGITASADVLSHIAYSGGSAIIDLGGGNSVTISNVADGSLTAEDFLIV